MSKTSIRLGLFAATVTGALWACSSSDPPGTRNSPGNNTSAGSTSNGSTDSGSTGNVSATSATTTSGTTTSGPATSGPATTGTGPTTGVTTGASQTTTGGPTGNTIGGVTGFVFDASPASAGGDGSECGLQNFNIPRRPADVFLLLDRSGTMACPAVDPGGTCQSNATNPAKWTIVTSALSGVAGGTMGVVSQTNALVSWGMKTFPEGADNVTDCSPTTFTNKIDVPVAAMNATAVNNAIQATLPLGNGTPMGQAIKRASDYLQSLTDGNPKYILLATDGAPSCTGTAGALTKDVPGSRTLAIQEVTNALNAGIPTFVIGIGTTAVDNQTLTDLANAGAVPNDPAFHLYQASDAAALGMAFDTITTNVAKDCAFNLVPPPPIPDNVRVCVGGSASMCLADGGTSKLARDPGQMNGWDYTDMTGHSSLQIWGAKCDELKKTGEQVQIIYGCPKIDVRVN